MLEKNAPETLFERYTAPLSLVVLVATMVITGIFVTTWDMGQLYPSTQALLEGNFTGIYAESTPSTSLPAWVLAVALPYKIFNLWLPSNAAWPAAGILLSFPPLFFSVLYASRKIYAERSPAIGWGLAAASVILPTTLAAFFEFYHPQDIAATALLIFALVFTHQKRWFLAAVLFGFAVLTRQWALLPLLVSLPFLGRNWWKFIGVASSVIAVVCAPFLLVGNPGFLDAASGSQVAYRTQTPIGTLLFTMTNTTLERGQTDSGTIPLLIVRSLPVLLAAGATVYLATRKKLTTSMLFPAVAAVLVGRTLVESVPYIYYWAPAIVVLTLMTKKAVPLITSAFALGAALTIFAVSLNSIPAFVASGLWLALNAAALFIIFTFTGQTEVTPAPTQETDPEKTSRKPKEVPPTSAPLVASLLAAGLAIYIFSAQYFNPETGGVDPTREMGPPTILQLAPEDIGINQLSSVEQ